MQLGSLLAVGQWSMEPILVCFRTAAPTSIGSLTRAYQLVEYRSDRDFAFIEINRRLRVPLGVPANRGSQLAGTLALVQGPLASPQVDARCWLDTPSGLG